MQPIRTKKIVLAAVLLTTVVLGASYGSSAIGQVPDPDPAASPIFNNPLGDNTLTITPILQRIIQWIVGIAASLALLTLVVGGIMYIISFGDENRTRKAKSIIVWAIIGLIVILLAYAFIITVAEIFGVASVPSGPQINTPTI